MARLIVPIFAILIIAGSALVPGRLGPVCGLPGQSRREPGGRLPGHDPRGERGAGPPLYRRGL